MNNKIFGLGELYVTRGVDDEIKRNRSFGFFTLMSIVRYIQGDFGEICAEDAQANEEALKYGDRIMGVYENPDDEDLKIWIITEADRGITTVLFPEEY